MAATARKKPAPRKKAPEKEPEQEPEKASEPMIRPMSKELGQFAMQVVNAADIKGQAAESIVLLKRELARVSMLAPSDTPRS